MSLRLHSGKPTTCSVIGPALHNHYFLWSESAAADSQVPYLEPVDHASHVCKDKIHKSDIMDGIMHFCHVALLVATQVVT